MTQTTSSKTRITNVKINLQNVEIALKEEVGANAEWRELVERRPFIYRLEWTHPEPAKVVAAAEPLKPDESEVEPTVTGWFIAKFSL